VLRFKKRSKALKRTAARPSDNTIKKLRAEVEKLKGAIERANA
jgi:hypothetical protein